LADFVTKKAYTVPILFLSMEIFGQIAIGYSEDLPEVAKS